MYMIRCKLLLMMMLFTITVNAQVLIDGLMYNLNQESLTAEITYGNKISGDLVIPETVEHEGKSYVVTSIGIMAFEESKELLSVVMPNSVTQIKRMAFYSCTKLASVYFSDNLHSIEQEAFMECIALTALDFPESLTSIGSAAFSSCSGLKTINIPKNVTDLASKGVGAWLLLGSKHPFSSCLNLEQITVDEQNPKYDSRENCNAIIETETNTIICACKNSVIPNSVTAIGDFAFCSTNFVSFIIPDHITTIGNGAFSTCMYLKEIVIPNSVTSIGE